MQATKVGDREIVLTQSLSASRAAVFSALTEAAQILAWMKPTHMSLLACEVDLHVGGSIRYLFERPNGRKLEVRGAFELVAPPHRFVYLESYDFSPLQVHVTTTLEETNGETLFTQTLRYGSEQQRDEDFPGVATSAKEVYPRLAHHLATARN